MIIVKEKWIKEGLNKDNKLQKNRWKNIKIQMYLLMKSLKILKDNLLKLLFNNGKVFRKLLIHQSKRKIDKNILLYQIVSW